MPFGLTTYQIELILDLVNQYPQINQVMIFGSRAMGIEKKGSDIDLAIVGDLNLRLLSNIKYRLEEDLSIPFFFDVIDYNSINNSELKDHIDQFGKIIFSRSREKVKP